MNARQSRVFRYLLSILGALIVACIIAHIAIVSKYNSTLHTSHGLADSEATYVDIHYRGGDTSSWLKRSIGLTGKIYDATLINNAENTVSSWTLRIDITGNCYLNQFWNGESEIHQHDSSGKELVQTLNLADYDQDSIKLDYTINESDLLIPLKKGDYIIYHPSESVGETPVGGGKEAVVGFILYFKEEVDVSDYSLEYYYQMGLMHGPLFVLIFVLLSLWVLSFGIYLAANMAYKRAQKEMELRRSGIACMAELYASIYIINLREDSLEVISTYSEENNRPKDLPASGQLDNLAQTEIDPLYRNLTRRFLDLRTLPERLSQRNSLAVECVSIHHGWSRLRFIVMDRKEGRQPERVLFTIQQINEEKKELDAIRNNIEKEQEKNRERKDYLDSIYQDALTPVRSILNMGNMILSTSKDEEVLGYASEIRTIGESFLTLANDTLDVSSLEAGRMKLASAPYSLQEIVSEAEKIVRISMEEKGIELKTDISRSVPDRLYGDGPKLKRIITGLITRMTGAVEKGVIQLQIFGKCTSDKDVHLLVSVRGSGVIQDAAEAGQGMRLLEGMLALMNSKLKTVQMGQDRDYYFELEQLIPDTDELKAESTEEAEN